MTRAEHKARHELLHQMFDELLADYLMHHEGELPSTINMVDFMKWSCEQTKRPKDLAIVGRHRNGKPN